MRETRYNIPEVFVRLKLKSNENTASDKKISNATDAVNVICDILSDLDRECFGVINLSANNDPINFNLVSMGTLTSSIISLDKVFASTILSNAYRVIAFHNHPSGSIDPSHDDIDSTRRMLLAGKILGIEMLDHIIFNDRKEKFSMRDSGLVSGFANDTFSLSEADELFSDYSLAASEVEDYEDLQMDHF